MKEPEFAHRFVKAEREGSRTLVLLHGTGGDENDLLPLGQALAPGAAMLSVRGKVLENGMPRFFRRFAEGVFDVEDLKYRTHELAAFLRSSRVEYGIEGEFVAVGYSNGANIAASLLLMHPGLLRAAVLLRAMVPFEPEGVAGLEGTHVFLGPGRRDPIVPQGDPERLRAVLESGGAEVALHWHGGGHALTQEDVTAARAWMGALPTQHGQG